jgi:glucose-6-phosphate 1-dehydrogenase
MNDSPSSVAVGQKKSTQESAALGRPAGPCAMVIFGASGDLTQRKLIPALMNLSRDNLLPRDLAVIGLARRPISDQDFRRKMGEGFRDSDDKQNASSLWKQLESRLFYLSGDLQQPETYRSLRDRLERCDRELQTGGNYLFYLSTAPELFGPAIEQLGESGLTKEENGRWRRVIIEKPFGHDLESARVLNHQLREVLQESQIYRIDHYLGKETVQNILVFRFANGIFEPLWNRRYIDHVQITVAEQVGVEDRGAYYDTAGALRDMVPNHLFQLVALIGMEPPPSLDADAIRDEQVKVFRSIRPYSLDDVSQLVVRGQYDKGMINGKPVPAYREEPKVPRDSHTETFAALKLEINNWRWADVPFYLRTGKRMARRHTEIVIQFRRAPHLLFRNTAITACQANQLVLSIQPEEGVSLRFGAKIPGPVVQLGGVTMDFDYARRFGNRPSTGYERLLYDCMIGDPTLFRRADMSELGWAIVEPILKSWEKQGNDGLMKYPAGSWGPEAASELLARDGRHWRELDQCD